MSMSDPIADMLTRVRNASAARHASVDIPHSRLKAELARIMKREGYIVDYTTEGADGKRDLRVFLKYDADENPIIQGIKRVSRPGLRTYVKSTEAPRVLGGLGIAVLSTSRGLLTDREARKHNAGGEVLCKIW